MMLRLSDRRKIRLAKKHGILMPRRLLKAAKKQRIPFSAACAFAMQETSGGRNIYGQDGGRTWPFYKHGDVTKCNYRVYKIEADRTGKRQGVGPLQLTHESYQNRADELGGCWRPYFNMLAAFEAIRGWLTDGKGWREIALLYSGGKEDYADEFVRRRRFWRDLMQEDDDDRDLEAA